MKKVLSIILLSCAGMVGTVSAQDDDMYFMPTKKEIQKQKEDKKAGIKAYYSGISKSDDQYNRRVGKDSLYDGDVLTFNVGKPSTSNDDIIYNFGDSTVQARDVDYKLSRCISRFDDYYYGWYDPWFCSRYYWGRPWYYGPYWYGPWYDPWYDPWFYGYYDPYYFRYCAFWGWPYDPFWYGPGWYRPYGPVIPGGFVVHEKYRPGYGPRNDAQRNDPHFYANHSSHTSSHSGGFGTHSGTKQVASRNGDAVSRPSGHSYNYAERNSGWRRESSFGRSSDNNYSSSRSYGSNDFGGGGGGYSGGSYSGGGHSGGGGFSGGGGGHSGAHHR